MQEHIKNASQTAREILTNIDAMVLAVEEAALVERFGVAEIAAINDEQLPPLVQAALVHAQFETIHPFDDGNGRTGRALIHVVFKRRGLAPKYLPPISVALAAAKDRYIAGLTGFRAAGAEA